MNDKQAMQLTIDVINSRGAMEMLGEILSAK